MRPGLRALGVMAAMLVAAPAHAVEGEQHFSLGPMLSFLRVDRKTTIDFGAGAMARYSYRLTDQIDLTGSASWAIVAADQQQDTPQTPRNRPAVVGDVTVGASWVLDLLKRWNPWGGVEGGLYWLSGGTLPATRVSPGGSVAIGLDFFLTPHVAVGVEGRQHFLLAYMDDYSSYTTGLFRVTLALGR